MSTSGLHMYTTNTNKFVKFLVPSLVNYFEKIQKLLKVHEKYERRQTQIPQRGLEALQSIRKEIV